MYIHVKKKKKEFELMVEGIKKRRLLRSFKISMKKRTYDYIISLG